MIPIVHWIMRLLYQRTFLFPIHRPETTPHHRMTTHVTACRLVIRAIARVNPTMKDISRIKS
ncbi:hypothetical protein KAZ93_00970 [Patescibacteria group bacterium]|nr:hypothetical protein [Patescibacteria group bacterium]